MMGMSLAARLLPLLTLPPNVLAAPHFYQNVTIPMPPGTRVFTNPNEICLPASWTDILAFYLANYLAHVATLRLEPDTTTASKVLHATFCLIFPATGLDKAMDYILSCASFCRDPLQKAARAGALFHVVRRQGWKPMAGVHVENCVFFDDGGRDESINGMR